MENCGQFFLYNNIYFFANKTTGTMWTQSTGMVTQMQLKVILAGNRIATGVL